ncbi:2-hydroxymuconate tautomerase family protein [Clostridium sp. CX1]|uniref:Tautomerase n=1 Tax=Clostridium tanneri TaxID=3037988 RepID=A0ABU4JRR4_9CLOT|nr:MULTISPECIES: 4-oxalocrotonate tautomerase DmpI [unclassified Clostridium]MCT8977838.1 2-hydroxymuconate tautomerase family protein [Clostridium sp. CX1]MDW8800808.1 2-hydroxymuconate tautomerase family protein [Clostridium sp. A1-XYC3]
MPVVKVGISKLTKEKKKEVIERVSETLSDITNIPKQAFVVLIDEYDADNVGVGGVQLSEHK